ncbi:MAG: translation initiation factor IF-3 [Desulfobulbaceae bacterium A2]|nr:MAG: translation initiation factor IF-3 [Desulfobulbaceae bacterium A2]
MNGRVARDTKPQQEGKFRINEEINYPEVRLVGNDGQQLGIVSSREALRIANDQGLDLIEVAATATPPVCRIINYDKFRYELKKKQQEAKKRQTVVETREIKVRPRTDDHDLEHKVGKIREFLAEKNKVKITMRFRGREITYAESQGLEALRKISASLGTGAVILQEPRMEGKQLVMLVGPAQLAPLP